MGLKPAGQSEENALGKDQARRSAATPTACSDCSESQTFTPDSCDPPAMPGMSLQVADAATIPPQHRGIASLCSCKGLWTMAHFQSKQRRLSLCRLFCVKAHPELWKCLLNPFFLVLQVTVVVWRGTARAQGLPGRRNDG